MSARRRLGRRVAVAAAVLAATAGGCVDDYGPDPGPFPNLNDAENHLQAAIMALRQAPPIVGGHKAEAVRLAEAAIGEIEQARADAR